MNDETGIEFATIAMTNAPPLRIRADLWPVIAGGEWHEYEGEFASQANRSHRLLTRVRRHADGRTIVYCTYVFRTLWANERGESARRGELIGADGDVIAAIHRVTSAVGRACEIDGRRVIGTVQECIESLPAIDI